MGMHATFQDEYHHQVQNQADGCNDQHLDAFHHTGGLPAAPGFDKDANRDGSQADPVHQRRQDLQAVETEGVAIIRRQAGQSQGGITQDQRQDIHQDMRCIRQQCQAAGEDAAGHLTRQDEGGHDEGQDESFFDIQAIMRRHEYHQSDNFCLNRFEYNIC